MQWIVVILVIVVLFALMILFMRGATHGRPDWYQQELDDEQMKIVGKQCRSEKIGK